MISEEAQWHSVRRHLLAAPMGDLLCALIWNSNGSDGFEWACEYERSLQGAACDIDRQPTQHFLLVILRRAVPLPLTCALEETGSIVKRKKNQETGPCEMEE